ncbi:hypothetical protein, partial [Phocaeicola vulgatus]|uniref:hypothetical protein n=1 Tax=Phocaeicola vulgatus TaxID=821 RepID=UPI001C391380
RHYEHTLPNIRGSLSNTYPDPTIIHHSIRNCMYTYSDSPSLWGTEQSAGIWVGRRNRRTA